MVFWPPPVWFAAIIPGSSGGWPGILLRIYMLEVSDQ